MTTSGTLTQEELMQAAVYYLRKVKEVDGDIYAELQLLASDEIELIWEVPEKFEHAIDLGGESG